MELDEADLSKNLLCLACLCVGKDVHKITDEKLNQYYSDIIDELPLKKGQQFTNYVVCWECQFMVQKCYAFREQVKDSYRILQTYTKKNFHKCLKNGMLKPPRLKTRTFKDIDIPPSEAFCHVPLDVVKSDPDEDWQSNNDSIHDMGDDTISTFDNNHFDNGEELETELQTIMSSMEKEDKKRTRNVKNKVKKKKKIKSLKQNKKLEESLLSDLDPAPHISDQTAESTSNTALENEELFLETPVAVKTELRDNWERLREDITEAANSKEEMVPNTQIDRKRDLEIELRTIMSSIESEDMNQSKDVKSKLKKSKKVIRSLMLSKPKRRKYESKMLVIELNYEEMLIERELDSTRDSYVNAEFKCETCLMGFNYKKSYQAHINTKHLPEIGEYICPICKTIISSVDSFTCHYKRHIRRYECVICQKRTCELKAMQQHFYSAHEISLKDYTCTVCGHVSNSIDAHRYHRDFHKARLQCNQCDKTFRHRAGLMNHRLTVHESQNVFPCTICDKVFSWKTSLKRHLDRHEAKDKYSSSSLAYCSACNISFASVCSYQRHMKNSLKHVSEDQLKYTCDECKRRFSDKTKLRNHIEEKHLHKKYQCHICSKPSKNRVGLDQHIRNVHKGRPKNKMCHHCGRGFPTTLQLECHIRTHTGERPFICEYCPTTFSQKSNWHKHYRQVHLNIKSKRYPMCKKKTEENTEQVTKVPTVENNQVENNQVENDPFRPIVLQYSPERGFVL